MDDLRALEYPRHLHRADGSYLRVNDADEAEAAVADGWTVAYRSPDDVAADAQADEPAAAASEPIEPKKRGRKSKAE